MIRHDKPLSPEALSFEDVYGVRSMYICTRAWMLRKARLKRARGSSVITLEPFFGPS